jgi:hypothetical protein
MNIFNLLNVEIKFLIIALYICLFLIIVYFKPSFLYDEKNECFRQFGVGYKNTTFLPLWLLSILLAIFSYFIVVYTVHITCNTYFIKG